MRFAITTAAPSASLIENRSANLRLSPARRAGFTLTEVMVVIVIIVLMIGIALPVFHTLTGSRSEAGASNEIAAMLGRARSDAIGLDKPMGVAFVYNPNTHQSYMAEVYFPDCPEYAGLPVSPGTCVKRTSGILSYYFYYYGTSNSRQNLTIPPVQADFPNLPNGTFQWVGGPPLDIVPSTDLLPLPAGIGVQTVCNGLADNSGQRTTDGYLANGVILFDGQGRLASLPYGIAQGSTLMADLNVPYGLPVHNSLGSNIGVYNVNNVLTQFGVMSQFGLVIFQNDAFVSQGFPTNDPIYNYPTLEQRTGAGYTSPTPSQQAEETWLDTNATPLLIDRYTGTLVKGQ